MPGEARGAVDDFFRRTFGHDFSAAGTTFGTEVNDPVRRFDHIQIMFDDEQRVAGVAQLEQHFEQFRHVVKMQAGRRLVQNVERLARRPAA